MHKKLSRNAILTLIVAMGIVAGAAVLAWQSWPGIDPLADARAAACSESDNFDLTTYATSSKDGSTETRTFHIEVSGDDFRVTSTLDGTQVEVVTVGGVSKMRQGQGPWEMLDYTFGPLMLYDDGALCSDVESDAGASFRGRSTVDGVGVRRYTARSSHQDGNWDILVGDNNQLFQTTQTWTFDGRDFNVRSRYSGLGDTNVISDPEATTPRPTPTPTATPTPGPTATPTPTPEPTATPDPSPRLRPTTPRPSP